MGLGASLPGAKCGQGRVENTFPMAGVLYVVSQGWESETFAQDQIDKRIMSFLTIDKDITQVCLSVCVRGNENLNIAFDSVDNYLKSVFEREYVSICNSDLYSDIRTCICTERNAYPSRHASIPDM